MHHIQFFCVAFVLAGIFSTYSTPAAFAADAASSANYYSSFSTGHPFIWFREDMPLKVLIHSGEKVSGWTPRHDELLKKAFLKMSEASSGKLRFKFVDNKPYDIECLYRPMGIEARRSNKGADTRRITGLHHIEEARIAIDSDNSKFTDYGRFFEVALHEIGHAVGLGHSPASGDVMYSVGSTSAYKTDYSLRDRNTIARLYKFRPTAEEVARIERQKQVRYQEQPQAKTYKPALQVASDSAQEAVSASASAPTPEPEKETISESSLRDSLASLKAMKATDTKVNAGPGTIPVTIFDWMKQVRKTVTADLSTLPFSPGASVDLRVRIKPDGYISSISVECSSGNSQLDEAVMRHCRQCEPFSRPPGESVPIQELVVTFSK